MKASRRQSEYTALQSKAMQQNLVQALRISSAVMTEILDSVGRMPPETGGILGAGGDGVVSSYYFDRTGAGSANSYVPDVEAVNALLAGEWMPNGVLMVGIVHSHTGGNRVPSCGDISYGAQILQALDTVDCFYLPIITQASEGACMDCYAICRDPEHGFICLKVDYVIVD